MHEKPAEDRINTTYSEQPPGVVKQEEVHVFTLKACPGVMAAKGHNIQQIIQVVTKTINRKTGFTAVFYPTTKGKYPPQPIANISANFPASQTEVRDFFEVRHFSATKAEVYLAFSMKDSLQKELHDSLKNTLKEYSLWLTSAELESMTPVWVGWIQAANPTYTNPQRQDTKIQEEIIKLAEVNPDASRSRKNIM